MHSTKRIDAVQWEPVYKDNQNIQKKLQEISRTLCNVPVKAMIREDDMVERQHITGHSSGIPGISLFLFYYARYFNDEGAHIKALQLLHESIEEIEKGGIHFSFSRGLSGFGWIMEHLVKNDFLEADTFSLMSPFDPYLYRYLIEGIEEKGNYDFLHGPLGIAWYFAQKPDKQRELDEFLTKLFEKAKKTDQGIFWRTSMWIAEEQGGWVANFGLSHGMASLIFFFNYLLKEKILAHRSQEIKEYLSSAIQYILAHRLPDDAISVFPNKKILSVSVDADPKSRLGWCYGDLTLGLVLWESATIMQDDHLRNVVLEAWDKTLPRKNPGEEGINDAGFCHGSGGLAYIYSKIYRLTGLEKYKEQSQYWFDVTLKKGMFDDGFAGFKVYRGTKGFQRSVGLLDGISGIGLTLLSAMDDRYPSWEKGFLL